MRVLGIDPGTITCGYGVVDLVGNQFRPVAYGAIACGRKMAFEDRLVKIFTGLEKVIQEYEPDCAAIEEAFAGKSVQSALRIGEARGIAILSAAKAGLPIEQYSPASIKKAVVGAGGAHKTQVQYMVKVLLCLSEVPDPDDVADALAIALCHCNRLLSQKSGARSAALPHAR